MRVRLSDLAPGVNYSIQLRSNTGDAVSDWSRIFNVVTSSDTVAPLTPTGISASMDGTSFNLSWAKVVTSADGSPANDMDHYEVLVSSTGTGTSGIYLVNDTKFQFTLDMNRTLFGSPRANIIMQVRAVDNVGNASAYSATFSQTNPAPANPTGFAGAAVPDAVNFKWNAVADSDLMTYRLYSGTTAGSQTTLEWSGLATSTTLQSIQYAVDKWFKVAAVDVFGTESPVPPVVGPLRPNSPFVVDTTAPPVPTGLTASLVNSSDESYAIATVSWTAVSDADNDLSEYIIGYRPVSTTDWQYTKVDYTNTSTKINGLLPYTNYEFRIRSSDWSANLSGWSATVTATAATNSAPSTPAAPTAASSLLRVQVTHNNTKSAGGAMEGDVEFYEVYGSTTTGFTPAAANQLGVMPVGPAIIGTFMLPATGGAATQTWYIKVIAVDRGGLKSAASAQVTATPGLIDSTSIVDATITDAKIGSLSANKITAGSGFINDITVKSKFTLGDASTVGIIESYGYVAGTTGFHLDKNLLEINQGSIAAGALKIQSSSNIMPVQFADFEFVPSYYTVGTTGNMYSAGAPTSVSILSASPKFNKQYLSASWAAAVAFDPYIYFAPSVTTYNIPVEAGETYILSGYARATGSVATNLILAGRLNNGSAFAAISVTLPASNSAWVRYSAPVTIPAGVTAINTYAQSTTRTAGAGFELDGIQLERKVAALSTPSPWTPPGATSIDAGIIRTGQMQSTSTLPVNGVSQPAWSINMSGNAQFGDALVRGKLLVGQSGTDVDAGQSYIASGNYVAATTGWKIDSAGNAEFNSGTFRGQLKVGITDTSGNVIGTQAYVQSRGSTDLVTNGSGILGDNTNFSAYTFDKIDTPIGTSGSFNSAATTQAFLDEFMAVDPSRKYLFRFQAKQKSTSVDGRVYSYLTPYDAYNYIISPQFYMFQNNTTTTLAVDLKPGDTTITLTNAANWNNAAGTSNWLRSMIVWGYTDPGGRVWEERSYSRDWRQDLWADGGITGNVITLKTPWVGFTGGGESGRTTIPAGTVVSNGSAGGNYMYGGAINTAIPKSWTTYQAEFGGIMPYGTSQTSMSSATNAFPPGTAKTKIGFLQNRTAAGALDTTSKHSFAAVSLSDATQAQSLTEAWRYGGTTTINGGLIQTQTLTANQIGTGQLAASVRIIAGPETGTHAEVTATGFYVYTEDPDGGAPVNVVRMGVSDTNDSFAISDALGNTLASIDENGGGNFAALSAGTGEGPTFDADGNLVTGVSIYGREFSSYLNALPKGNVAFSYRGDPSAYTSTEQPYIQLDATLESGRLYHFHAKGIVANSLAGARAIVVMRYRRNNGAAQITDPAMQYWRTPSTHANGSPYPFVISHGYATGDYDGTTYDISLLLTVYAEGGGTVKFASAATDPTYFWIDDMGIYGGDVGIDRQGGTTPPPTKKTYTTTWKSTTQATYQGGGSKRTDTTDVVQGYNSYNGDGKGLWIFPNTITSTLSGATVSKVEVYCYANHWYYNSGGTALIKVHGYTSAPASSPSMTTATSSSGWPNPGGRWVTLPSSLYAGFISGSYKGFGLGPSGGSNLAYYGRFNGGTGAQIRITYLK